MSLHTVFYEFPLNRETIADLIDDLGVRPRSDRSFDFTVKAVLDGLAGTYSQVQIPNKPALAIQFSRKFDAERLPHPIEGAKIFVHASSEAQLELDAVSNVFEASLERYGVQYIKYQ